MDGARLAGDGVGVASDHGEVGEAGLRVEAVERVAQVVDGGTEADEHRDSGGQEQSGEDEAEAVAVAVRVHESGEGTPLDSPWVSHPFVMVSVMCMMCEGFSQEDMFARDAAIIEEHGYLVTGVGDGDPPHWA